MNSPADLDTLSTQELKQLASRLLVEMRSKQALIDKLTHGMATLRRPKFAATSEAYSGEKQQLLFETMETDLAALAAEIETLAPATPAAREKQQPRRAPLPANLPRKEVRHEPASTTCSCGCQLKRIGEDIPEKLDYQPGVFTVERHVRGKWVCSRCETLVQAPVPAHVIDKGIPTAGLLAMFWSPNMRITCRCIGNKASSSVPGWRSPIRRWRTGSVPAVCNCNVSVCPAPY
jgi:transposase